MSSFVPASTRTSISIPPTIGIIHKPSRDKEKRSSLTSTTTRPSLRIDTILQRETGTILISSDEYPSNLYYHPTTHDLIKQLEAPWYIHDITIMPLAEETPASGAYVAPLKLHKTRSRASSKASLQSSTNTSSRNSLQQSHTQESSNSQSQITPPTTPNASQEDLNGQLDTPQPVFHNFLRAFAPYRPTNDIADSTVTLALNEGDVVLVHSIHTNGWADGTLLLTGARGWLPTNYCEGFEPPAMQMLLKALLCFWDVLRSGLNVDGEVFANQNFMQGLIAGVRYLLEKSNCLLRDAALVRTNEKIRRSRRTMLSLLASLVKTAKRLQDIVTSPDQELIDLNHVNDIVDEMILEAFRIVVRGVKFLETVELDFKMRTPVHRAMSTVTEESYNPPTPPADLISFDGSQQTDQTSEAASRRTSRTSMASASQPSIISHQTEEQTRRQSYRKSSHITTSSSRPLSMTRPASMQIKRQSISHRLSLTSGIPATQRDNAVFHKLNATHDTFLSYLGSFIGRLHLQSQLSGDLIVTVQRSLTAGGDLLTVVEAVSGHDQQSAEFLDASRMAMYEQITFLASTARDVFKNSGSDGEDCITPQQNGFLLDAATACVMAAGECVAKTRFVIERIGDFEFEAVGGSLGIDVDSIGAAEPASAVTTAQQEEDSIPQQPTTRPPPPPLIIPNNDKPLPEVPQDSPDVSIHRTSLRPLESVHEDDSTESGSSNRSSRRSLLPPLTRMGDSFLIQDDYSPSDASQNESVSQSRVDSGAISSIGTNSTYISHLRDSELSALSATSTRATTPDVSPSIIQHSKSFSDLSTSMSQSTLIDESFDVESTMLEKTFAHELLHNKEGHITGGTLPALVEQLTTHDSTPDSTFVSTFYLTFRLFASPIELAQALIDRFDYVADVPHIAGPVRSRVYNVFKGWLSSHWRNLSDEEALPLIELFAKHKLDKKLPGAGKRLLDLAQRVSSAQGPLVPRQISSMGKTSTSIAQYVAVDAPLPAPIFTRSQLSVLKNWKMGGSMPSILDFDPIEVARQLTIKEMNIFSAIMPEELLGCEWTKKSGSNATNVRAMSTLSTDLSNLVSDTILHYDDAKRRAVVVKQWIKVAHRCLELNNYQSLLAIVCSLNSSIIARLKKTWDLVSAKRRDMYQAIQAVVDPEKNYANLRRRLHDTVPPCLPFVGMYLTDLTFVDAGNPSTKQLPLVGDGAEISVVNFDKHTRTARIIGELQRFQIPYRLAEIPELQEWIQAQIVRVKSTSDHENFQQYYRKSLLLEPRENNFPRPSPVETASSFSGKDKFDIFGWSHSRDKSGPMTPAV